MKLLMSFISAAIGLHFFPVQESQYFAALMLITVASYMFVCSD